MSKKPSPTLIGVFVLGGAALLVVAVIVWGSGRLFERRIQYVCYFPGTVNGLTAGAPVRFRGVPIGEVSNIRIRYDQATDDNRIPVFIELSEKRIYDFGVHERRLAPLVEALIKKGLRAQLENQSLVTGQLYVNLDFFPNTPIQLVHTQRGYPEIPTIPAPLEEAKNTISGLVDQLGRMDLAGIARSLENTIEGINRLVSTPSIAQTLKELPSTVASVRGLVQNVDAGLGRVGQEVQSVLAARGPVLADLQRALVDVQHAAEAVRRLAEYLERNPNALIVGKKRQ
jgi:paraquat-inducible protein B